MNESGIIRIDGVCQYFGDTDNAPSSGGRAPGTIEVVTNRRANRALHSFISQIKCYDIKLFSFRMKANRFRVFNFFR